MALLTALLEISARLANVDVAIHSSGRRCASTRFNLVVGREGVGGGSCPGMIARTKRLTDAEYPRPGQFSSASPSRTRSIHAILTIELTPQVASISAMVVHAPFRLRRKFSALFLRLPVPTSMTRARVSLRILLIVSRRFSAACFRLQIVSFSS